MIVTDGPLTLRVSTGCPACKVRHVVDVTCGLEAKPPGTYSIAGAQVKAVCVETWTYRCTALTSCRRLGGCTASSAAETTDPANFYGPGHEVRARGRMFGVTTTSKLGLSIPRQCSRQRDETGHVSGAATLRTNAPAQGRVPQKVATRCGASSRRLLKAGPQPVPSDGTPPDGQHTRVRRGPELAHIPPWERSSTLPGLCGDRRDGVRNAHPTPLRQEHARAFMLSSWQGVRAPSAPAPEAPGGRGLPKCRTGSVRCGQDGAGARPTERTGGGDAALHVHGRGQ